MRFRGLHTISEERCGGCRSPFCCGRDQSCEPSRKSPALPAVAAGRKVHDTADVRLRIVSSLEGWKPAATIVAGMNAAGSATHFISCWKSSAMRVSGALPYSSPNTPHQYYRASFSWICGSSERCPMCVKVAASGIARGRAESSGGENRDGAGTARLPESLWSAGPPTAGTQREAC